MRLDEIDANDPPYKPTEGLALALVIVAFEIAVVLAAWVNNL